MVVDGQGDGVKTPSSPRNKKRPRALSPSQPTQRSLWRRDLTIDVSAPSLERHVITPVQLQSPNDSLPASKDDFYSVQLMKTFADQVSVAAPSTPDLRGCITAGAELHMNLPPEEIEFPSAMPFAPETVSATLLPRHTHTL